LPVTTISIDEEVKKKLEALIVGKETWTETISRLVDRTEKMKTLSKKMIVDYEKFTNLMLMLKEQFEAIQQGDIYGALLDMEDSVKALNDARLNSLYDRLIEDYRGRLPQEVLRSDYTRFWERYTKIAEEVDKEIQNDLSTLKEFT